ncbi:MAG: hypothetical protein COT90_00125 [Candidatus Diapherotrites archaeon CG10_big_fil_rev_8_21_14_0_10_31_34]|nr:MAG: hypothetical protein COT90_00125 [Candidatus Diapherotrites archaeon CG10_big_fil_rev_8_21_14_0_10_31_34]
MEKGDIAVIDYTATNKSSEKIFDSTIKENAVKAGIFDEKINYAPVSITIGNNELLKSLEEEITKMKAGEEKKILLKAAKAFGERSAELIKVMPMKEFIARDIRPVPGLIVELNDMRGKIQSVSGGRIRVDFNHELAGKDVEYEVKIEKILTEKKDKLIALKEKFFGEKAKLKEEKDKIEVLFDGIVPEPRSKAAFAETIFKSFKEIKKLSFTEEIEQSKEKTNEAVKKHAEK